MKISATRLIGKNQRQVFYEAYLDCSSCDVAVMRQASREGGSIVKSELWLAFG